MIVVTDCCGQVKVLTNVEIIRPLRDSSEGVEIFLGGRRQPHIVYPRTERITILPDEFDDGRP